MEEKFYTINQVAEILDMHHKTIRNFISEGKLSASKVGKQWRISEEDIHLFMEKSKELTEKDDILEFSVNEKESHFEKTKINVSAVIDIEEIDKEQYMRISNTLIAIMNSKDSDLKNSTINLKYYENYTRLKILLWGEVKFMEEMLSSISLLVK